MDLFQIICLKQHKNIAVKKNVRVTINFYEKRCLPVATWNKNNLPKQVVPIIYKLEKRFLQLLYFWRFVSCFLSGRVKKLVVYFGLYESSLDFQRREDQINTLLMRTKFIFLYLVSFMSGSVNLTWKMEFQKAGCVFRYFCGGHKNSLQLRFRSSFKQLLKAYIELYKPTTNGKNLKLFVRMIFVKNTI